MNNQISAGTIARTICLALALVNQILESTGHGIIPIDNELVSCLISDIFLIASAIAAWWKNNSFTADAIKADEYLEELRNK